MHLKISSDSATGSGTEASQPNARESVGTANGREPCLGRWWQWHAVHPTTKAVAVMQVKPLHRHHIAMTWHAN